MVKQPDTDTRMVYLPTTVAIYPSPTINTPMKAVYYTLKGSATEDKIIVDKDLNPNLSQKRKNKVTPPRKWDIEKYMTNGKVINDDKSNVNWYFLRYADVLLLYAEALNEWKGAPTDKAYEAVNMVRARGYGHPSSTKYKIAEGMDQEQFRRNRSLGTRL